MVFYVVVAYSSIGQKNLIHEFADSLYDNVDSVYILQVNIGSNIKNASVFSKLESVNIYGVEDTIRDKCCFLDSINGKIDLKELFFSYGYYEELPKSVITFKSLKILGFHGLENFTEISEEIYSLTELEELTFSGVGPISISTKIGNLKKLKTFDFYGSLEGELPKEFFEIETMEYLEINFCCSVDDILKFKNLKELFWRSCLLSEEELERLKKELPEGCNLIIHN